MGSKLSPTLAILVMDRLERSTVFLRTLSSPLVFLRYIDDCAVIVDEDTDFPSLLSRLNTIHSSIKFEMEKPDNFGFLPILDTGIHIDPDGKIKHKFFVKDANKGLFINATSALPTSTKRNAMLCELQRAQQLCSDNEDRTHATSTMMRKFRNNDYSVSDIRRATKMCNRKSNNKRYKQAIKDSCILKVPYISEKFNCQLRRLVKKSGLDIFISTRPAKPLSRILYKIHRFRKCNKTSCPIKDPSICCVTNVVYKASCTLCPSFYIGSTSPPFHERVTQHLQPSRRTPVYLHAKVHHRDPRDIFIFSIISRHDSKLRCRIAEAMTINNLRPDLNGKDEFINYRLFLV